MSRRLLLTALLLAGVLGVPAAAQDLLIRNAKLVLGGTATARTADILVRNGKIAAIGNGFSGVNVIDAQGKFVTPALFAGITDIGVEEVSGERSTVDASLSMGQRNVNPIIRPEFDVTLAYNPDSVLIPVNRAEGMGWSLLSAGGGGVSSIVLGQGGVVRLHGDEGAIGPRALFVELGSAGAGESGNSRAAQWMVLDQLLDEVRGRIAPTSQFALLTPAGRDTLRKYLNGQGRVFASVQRASDIRQLLRWSAANKVKVAIVGGDEAWKVAPQLAAAKVPVFVNALNALPSNFDSLGTRLDNAALLVKAGVPVSFYFDDMQSHMAYKLRQLAGNAVANGMRWEDAFAGLTTVPADAMGVASRVGSVAVGRDADLVVWTGDPLDVASVAERVIMSGKDLPLRSRQSELRDRYTAPLPDPAAGQLPRAYD